MTGQSSTQDRPAILPFDFRRACGQFTTGVMIVTVPDGDGICGMTANSVTSVSLDPPLVLVSIGRRNRTHELVRQQGRFAVNMLAQHHQLWSDRFAGRGGDLQHAFDDVSHRLITSLPVIDGAPAAFDCRLVAAHSGGDHSLFVGEVERLECHPTHELRLFFGRRYRALSIQIDGVTA